MCKAHLAFIPQGNPDRLEDAPQKKFKDCTYTKSIIEK